MVQEFITSLQSDPWVWNFLCVNAGIIIHTLKKCSELQITILDYWKAHKGRGLTSLLSVYGSYLALMLTNSGAGTGEFLAIGYMLDSALNKAPEPKQIQELRAEVEDLRHRKERREREVSDA
jgi:hypothetical protein